MRLSLIRLMVAGISMQASRLAPSLAFTEQQVRLDPWQHSVILFVLGKELCNCVGTSFSGVCGLGCQPWGLRMLQEMLI